MRIDSCMVKYRLKIKNFCSVFEDKIVAFTFSGHEKFACRQFWLKKGYDFIEQGGKFSASDTVVRLGVGKNMTTSIRYWLSAFGLTNKQDKLTDIAHNFFSDKNGYDPYLENIGSLWLMHYLLVITNRASIYSLVFNEFRRERIEFTKEHLLAFLERQCAVKNFSVSKNTLNNDIQTFTRNYLRPNKQRNTVEEDFMTLFIDLNLVQLVDRQQIKGSTLYKIESLARPELPTAIVLYSILDQQEGRSISFNRLLNDDNNVGVVYGLTSNGLMEKIDRICSDFPEATFTDDAGNRELQFTQRPDKFEVLNRYYGR